MSAKNEATAVHGTYLAAILYGGFGILSPLVGIAMYRLLPGMGPQQTEYLIVSAAVNYLNPLLAALFVAALASALMSTSDSSILAGASIVTENILPSIRKNLSEKQKLLWTRGMVVVIGISSLVLALFTATIYKLAIFAWTVLLVGQVAPFILGIYWKKANQKGALWGYLAGFIGWLVCMFIFYQTTMPANPGDLETALWDAAYMGSVPGFFISLLVLVGVSILTQKSDPPKPMLDVDDQPLPLKKRLGLLKPKDVF